MPAGSFVYYKWLQRVEKMSKIGNAKSIQSHKCGQQEVKIDPREESRGVLS